MYIYVYICIYVYIYILVAQRRFRLKIWHELKGADQRSRIGMLRRCEAASMFRAVLLFFPFLLLLSLFPSLLLFVVSLLLLMFLLVRIGAAHICRRNLLSTEHFPRFMFVFFMLILVFSLRGLINISILLWQLQNYITYLINLFFVLIFYIYIFFNIEGYLTGPGCSRKPASCTLVKGNNSLPPIGGFSITDLNELERKSETKCNKNVIICNYSS